MPLSTCRAFDVHPTETTSAGHHLSSEAMHARRPTTSSSPGPHIYHDTTSQPRKGVVTGCQFGALGACPLVPGGCPHPTGWWGHPHHRQLPQEVPGTRDPTTARYIRRLHAVCEARSISHSRHHCAPAPRLTPHWARLVRRAVLRAAPRAPGLASRGLLYSDPDFTR
jgi:hypothetical protein